LRYHTAKSTAERRARAEELMREVALAEHDRLLAAYPHQLSGGQRQRVGIAIALALEPALLIADEPTTALDVTTQAQILKLIVELQRRHGMAVLFVTHDFGVVAEIAHRVAVLRQGRLVELGARDEVLIRPKHEYTRMLIGAVPTLKPRCRPLASDAPVVLEARGVSKTYIERGWLRAKRAVAAATEVSFTLRKGETLGIVGESGSGKPALERCPHQFSGGLRQRISIARALALEPEILVADEPVSALDVSVQAQVLALLDEIRARLDLAMLFITHDLRVAAQVCDHLAVMQ